ncbi:Uma2 family endonuclease [Candidatus Thiosymbion oneisti]|uniref:Uma2 family endonuclease n=1 Tax=Candidatus Thiosymbion oneisti TaxID=589554 RepID=UPI000AF84A30|nr:Uma2 family endonuclease [Candidatus Thiosymbion oneisti]
MKAKKLKTVDDLVQSEDERVELINGEIVKRPMARSEHALVQSGISDEVSLFKRKDGRGGWWIMPEISVRYNEHQCPSHDLAGWRKEHVPHRPIGVMKVIPDWVCEITSPGHERKDLFHNFMLLQRNKVSYYWVISPEDKALIAYELVDEKYRVTLSVEYRVEKPFDKAGIPPFEEVEIDLNYVFGDG